MYSILHTFRINGILVAYRTKFSIKWSHYEMDGVFDGEKQGHSTVPLHSVLRGQFCCVW